MSGNVVRGLPQHGGSTAYINARIVGQKLGAELGGSVVHAEAQGRSLAAWQRLGGRVHEIAAKRRAVVEQETHRHQF